MEDRRIYVGNLPFKVDGEHLRQMFEQFGEIRELKIATDRETGRSKGFGFVEFLAPVAAAAAIKEMDGKAIAAGDGHERMLRVAPAKPKQ